MNQIERLRNEVKAELRKYSEVIDEYEQTLDAVETTLEDSKLERTTGGRRQSSEQNTEVPVQPVGAD